MKLLIGALGILSYASWANAQTYTPQSVTTSIGKTSQSVSTLALKDSSGTQRVQSKYMGFSTTSQGYVGDLTFKVGSSSITSLSVEVNYRGDRKSTKEWSFQLYNNSTKKYDKIGDNANAASWAWSSLTFAVASDAAKYVNSSGVVLLRYTTSGSATSSYLDYAAVTVKAGTTTPPVEPPVVTPPVEPPVVTPPVEPPVTPPVTNPPSQTRAFNGVRAYGPKAPWNVPVAGLPRHAESEKFAGYLWNDFGGRIPEMNFRKYTYPVYDATKATAQYVVKDKNNWGNLNGKLIPFNPAWLANAGTDAQIIILDPATGKEWNLWEVTIDNSAKQINIGNGNLCPGDYLTNNWDNKATKCSGSRGVGINYLAMLVRPWEMEQGKIEHALSMPIIGTSGQSYVAPATKLEHPGKVGNIPEGMRFALNVSYAEIDAFVNAQTSLSAAKKKAIKTILVALKDYGWFVTDTAGGHAFQFEAPESAQAEWERIGVLPGQSSGGVEFPRYMLNKFLTKDRIITIVPSDQYPK